MEFLTDPTAFPTPSSMETALRYIDEFIAESPDYSPRNN